MQSLQRSVSLDASSPDSSADLVLLLTRLRRSAAAAEADGLLERFPDAENARRAAGEAYLSAARYQDALACFNWILNRSPNDFLAHIKRGFALASLGEHEASSTAFAQARSVDPQAVERFSIDLSGRSEAPAILEPRAIHLWALYLAMCECDWSGRDALVTALKNAGTSSIAATEPALAFISLLLPMSQAQRHALARTIAAKIEQRCPPLPPPLPAPVGAPLRVGVLSPDFREHLNAYLLLPLFELADRRRLEIYAYSVTADDDSGIRARIRRASHRFRDLHLLDSHAAAGQIRRDGIDVLLDVGGYSSGARFDITAYRPARVQALYLGFPGTLGSQRVEHVIADPLVLPPDDAPFWSEAPVYLPHTWFIYDFRDAVPEPGLTRASYALPEDAFVFCAFHRADKISPDTFALWIEILEKVPRSILWLLALSDAAQRNLRREAMLQGVDPSRLVFAPFDPRERYLARQRLGDLMLDAIHHSAMTTACDAMAAALPVLTLRGSAMASRAGESLLRAADLPELVAPDKDAYVARAVRLASDRPLLESYRRRLAERTAPLFDTAARVRELEAALLEIWRRHAGQRRPA